MEDFCLWDKQSGESGKAFEAFCIYRDLGSKRSLTAVYTKLSKSRQLISRWKQKFDWDKRTAAYDKAIEDEAQKEAVRSLKDMLERHINISVQLQKKALEALARIKSEELSPREIREFIKLATELERQSRIYQTSDGEQESEEMTTVDIYIPKKEGDNHE